MSSASVSAQSTKADLTFAGNFIGIPLLAGGVLALSAAAFTSVNPLTGALFGMTTAWGGHLVSIVNDKTGGPKDSIGVLGLKFLCAIGLGALATTLIGFPLNFFVGVFLTTIPVAVTGGISFAPFAAMALYEVIKNGKVSKSLLWKMTYPAALTGGIAFLIFGSTLEGSSRN